MSWLLETLHADLRSSSNTSIISKCFQGELEVVKEHANVVMETTRRLFLVLELDVPPPLFKNVMENYILPQVPLFNILKKFDGDSITEVVSPSIARMRFRVTRLPQYLVVHMHRFTKNNFFLKKNLTLGPKFIIFGVRNRICKVGLGYMVQKLKVSNWCGRRSIICPFEWPVLKWPVYPKHP